MVELKMWIIPVAALIPLVLGFIWYNPAVFGKAWQSSTGLTDEQLKGANMPVMFILSFIFACFIAFIMVSMTIHQMGLQSLVLGADESTVNLAQQLLDLTGNNYRTFGHGALHGAIGGIGLAFPILATNAMFERRGWKNIWINSGYWVICITLMGGVVCQFA